MGRAAHRRRHRQLAAFPQTCLRSDRRSLLDAEGLSEQDALASEFTHGQAAASHEALEGAARLSADAGRYGAS